MGSYRFTVCLVELEAAMPLFRGVYLRERRGLLGGLGQHELQISPDQDQARLRELFEPKTIVWLQDHPLRPHIEFRAGFLLVYVPGHLDDLGRLVWLLEAAERIAERVQAELGESQAAVG